MRGKVSCENNNQFYNKRLKVNAGYYKNVRFQAYYRSNHPTNSIVCCFIPRTKGIKVVLEFLKDDKSLSSLSHQNIGLGNSGISEF